MIRGNETAAGVLRSALVRSQTGLMRCVDTLAERSDPEAVHDARIEIRRLRSCLRTFELVADRSWCDAWRDRLEALGKAFGAARDAAAVVEALRASFERVGEDPEISAPMIEEAEGREREAERALRVYLKTADVRVLLTDLEAAAAVPQLGPRAAEPLDRVAPAVMQGLLERARGRARQARKRPSDRTLHRLRIAAKHLRYAAEALADTYGDDAHRFAKSAARLQAVLGDARDAKAAATSIAGRSDAKSSRVEAELAKAARRSTARWTKEWHRMKKRKNSFW